MPKNFMPGLELCGFCYSEIIKPILDLNFPDIRYSAALIGAGSEVLGFNTEMSQDHDWGLRVKLFFNEDDFAVKAKQIKTFIKGNLPNQFRAHPV